MENIEVGTIVEYLDDKDQLMVGEVKLYNPTYDFYLIQTEINGIFWCVLPERIIKQWS